MKLLQLAIRLLFTSLYHKFIIRIPGHYYLIFALKSFIYRFNLIIISMMQGRRIVCGSEFMKQALKDEAIAADIIIKFKSVEDLIITYTKDTSQKNASYIIYIIIEGIIDLTELILQFPTSKLFTLSLLFIRRILLFVYKNLFLVAFAVELTSSRHVHTHLAKNFYAMRDADPSKFKNADNFDRISNYLQSHSVFIYPATLAFLSSLQDQILLKYNMPDDADLFLLQIRDVISPDNALNINTHYINNTLAGKLMLSYVFQAEPFINTSEEIWRIIPSLDRHSEEHSSFSFLSNIFYTCCPHTFDHLLINYEDRQILSKIKHVLNAIPNKLTAFNSMKTNATGSHAFAKAITSKRKASGFYNNLDLLQLSSDYMMAIIDYYLSTDFLETVIYLINNAPLSSIKEHYYYLNNAFSDSDQQLSLKNILKRLVSSLPATDDKGRLIMVCDNDKTIIYLELMRRFVMLRSLRRVRSLASQIRKQMSTLISETRSFTNYNSTVDTLDAPFKDRSATRLYNPNVIYHKLSKLKADFREILATVKVIEIDCLHPGLLISSYADVKSIDRLMRDYDHSIALIEVPRMSVDDVIKGTYYYSKCLTFFENKGYSGSLIVERLQLTADLAINSKLYSIHELLIIHHLLTNKAVIRPFHFLTFIMSAVKQVAHHSTQHKKPYKFFINNIKMSIIQILQYVNSLFT